MTREAALILYARACVRLHAVDARHVEVWDANDVIGAFHALPGPVVPFERWLARSGVQLDAAEAEIAEHNEAAIILARLAAGVPVKASGVQSPESGAVTTSDPGLRTPDLLFGHRTPDLPSGPRKSD